MKKIIFIIPLFLIISCSSENWQSLKLKTEEALNNKNFEDAVEYLEEALKQEPKNAEIHYYLGQTYRLMLFTDGGNINRANLPYASKSSEHFRKAAEISPKYEGKKFVLDPYSKIQSVWSSAAMTYLYNNNPDSAKWAFKQGQKEGGFYPALLEYNKNIMASCDSNAILFTNGDNDTFPMWFLQLVENYRTDITVVNVNLLNVNWYIKQLKNSYPFGVNNIVINLSEQEIDSLRPKKWEARMIEVPVMNDQLNKEQKIAWLMKPTYENMAVRVQDLMMLDIIKLNNWVRPVYFSSTVDEINKIGLNEYLPVEGLVYGLNSHKCTIDPDRLYSNLTGTYTYEGVKDNHLKYADDILPLYQNYRFSFIELASFFADSKQKNKAKEVYTLMGKVLPEYMVPYTERKLKSRANKLRQKIQ